MDFRGNALAVGPELVEHLRARLRQVDSFQACADA
jgi:hypothetical protein